MLSEIVKECNQFYIYGAQVVAYGAYTAIRYLFEKIPVAFLVSRTDGNPSEIEGIAVKKPDAIPADTLVIVAVTELLQDEIVALLKEKGCRNIFRLRQHEEHRLMAAYFSGLGKFPLAQDKAVQFPMDFAVYEVRNHRDQPLSSRPILQSYEHTLQAGAVLTDARIAELADDSGDNISAKNKQYCEMTATYWVWKNTSHDWKGIEHYRRHLLVSPAMLTDDVDAILPLPYICYPNTLAQFRRFVSDDVLQVLLQALKELHPNEYDKYIAILQGKYQYTYNLVCARREVFDDYCDWFFRITKYMENMASEAPEIGNTRALSYVAEVLTNLYFMSHQDSLRIKHVEKAIYI